MGKYDWKSLKENLPKNFSKEKNDYKDPREWKLQRDENDFGTAIIRLLPGKGGNTPAIVKIFEHSIKMYNKPTNKYRYYIEPSPASIGEPCPVSEVYYELGEMNTQEAKEFQKQISRKVRFISNILVINDPANPENNGKIFYWKYGVKLYEKFQHALEPTEAQLSVGKKPKELFDPENGYNIILEAKKVGGFVNYDDTTFDTEPSRAFATDEEMDEAIMERCYDLNEFYDKSYYKPYAELKKHFAWVIEKTPLEAFLVENGSKVITDYYKSSKSYDETSDETSDEHDTTESKTEVKTSYTPKTDRYKKNTEKTESKPEPETKEPEDSKSEPEPETSYVDDIDDEELEAMLEDL